MPALCQIFASFFRDAPGLGRTAANEGLVGGQWHALQAGGFRFVTAARFVSISTTPAFAICLPASEFVRANGVFRSPAIPAEHASAATAWLFFLPTTMRSRPGSSSVEERRLAMSVAPSNPSHPSRLLRIEQVCGRVGLGRTYVYELIGQGLFPSPLKIGRASRWRDCELDAWIEQVTQSRGLAAD